MTELLHQLLKCFWTNSTCSQHHSYNKLNKLDNIRNKQQSIWAQASLASMPLKQNKNKNWPPIFRA